MSDDEKPTDGGENAISSTIEGNRVIRSACEPEEWLASDTTVLDLFGEFAQADPA